MPDYGTLKQEIKDSINEAENLDSFVAQAISSAFEWVERNNTYWWQRQSYTFILSSSIDVFQVDSLAAEYSAGTLDVKAPSKFIRYDADWNEYHLTHVRFGDLPRRSETGIPTKYFISRLTSSSWNVWLEYTLDDTYNYTFEIETFTRSTNGESDPTFEPPILRYAYSVVKARAVLYLSPYIRDAEMVQFYKDLLAADIKTLENANYEVENPNYTIPSMRVSQ